MTFAVVDPCSFSCMTWCCSALAFLWCILVSISSFSSMHALHAAVMQGFLLVFATYVIKTNCTILQVPRLSPQNLILRQTHRHAAEEHTAVPLESYLSAVVIK